MEALTVNLMKVLLVMMTATAVTMKMCLPQWQPWTHHQSESESEDEHDGDDDCSCESSEWESDLITIEDGGWDRNYLVTKADNYGDNYEVQCFDVETVKENMKHHTNRQIANAKRARELQTSLGCTTNALKLIVQQRMIEDNPVTPDHVDLSERIFGKDVAAMKGKKTRRQPGAVIDDSTQIPPEMYQLHPRIKLEIDVMFINDLPCLTGIDAAIFYRNFEAL